MTARHLVEALEKRGVRFEAAGNKLRVDAPKGLLNERLKALLARRKAEIIALLALRHQTVATNVYCFRCFKAYGKAARYQPHVVRPSSEYAGWLEYTCQTCGSKSYARPKEESAR